MIKRVLTSLFLSAVLILNSACFGGGPLSRLDSILDYAPLFFQGLVISNVITPEQSTAYQAGIGKLEVIADNTKTCLSADVKPNSACYIDMGNEVKNALMQYYPNVGGNSKISQYVALINDIAQLIIKKNVPTSGGPLGDVADIDKALDAKIDELETLLKSTN
jgi:hypothetical protein